MSSGLIVISSDDEPVTEIYSKVRQRVGSPINQDAEEVVYISSSDDDLFIPKKNMKSDPEELPKICFESREARRHRHRHKHRKQINENKHNADTKESSTDRTVRQISLEETSHMAGEPPRIPPLPDVSLFMSDTQRSGNHSSERRHKSQTKKSSSAKKKRQSIEEIKSKEREILGDLFAVDKTTKEAKRKLTLKDQRGKSIKNERTNPLKLTLVRDKTEKRSWNRHSDSRVKDLPEKTNDDRQHHSRSGNLSEKLNDNREQSRSRHSSDDKSADGTDHSKEKGYKRLEIKTDGVSENCKLVKKLSRSLSEHTMRNPVKDVISETNTAPHVPVHIDDRKEMDQSDMCHHVNCSRTGPFDLLASLDRSYRKELENLKVSPRSKNAVKKGMIPVVNLPVSTSLPFLRKKSKSIESSESESDNEKGRRHFMDVFSDISEAESDSSIKSNKVLNKGVVNIGNKALKKKENLVNVISDVDDEILTVSQNVGDKENERDLEMDITVIEDAVDTKTEDFPIEINQNLKYLPLNETSNTTNSDGGKDSKAYFVKLDEFSDISEDEAQTAETETETGNILSGVDENVFKPIGGNDYLGNATLSQTETDTDELVPDVTSEKKTETQMPILEKAFVNKANSSVQSFEMPILEKYTEMYSSFRTGLDEQEVLPDIEDDEIEVDGGEMMKADIAHKHTDKPSSHFSETSDNCNNIFTKFTLTPKSSCATSSSEVASSFLPFSSRVSTSIFSAMKPCKSEISLTSPKECSTPKTRKRKIRKSNTCSSFGSFETSSVIPAATSSHSEKLSLTKQMDQLTVYLEDFLDLNDSKLLLSKLPEAQKNIVYGCEEDGLLNLGHALSFIEHFCRKYIIPSDLCKDVIKSAFHSECKLSYIHWAYNLLSEMNTRRCAEIEIDWETMESCLKIALSTSKGKPYHQLLQATLLLQLGVDVLKIDLYTKELSDNRQIRKTFAYKMFAFDVSPGNRRSLIYFLNQALHAGQCRTGTEGEIFQLPDVLPMLQDLLELCVDVSSSCVDCANTLAGEMVNTYKFLPNLADKQLLIKSVSSQLLQCKLVQYVLESQYDCNQTLGVAFPDSLEDIIQCFFKVMPLKNPLTPPTTPNDDVFREDDGLLNMFSSEVTEEIAILLYFVVVSYLQVSNDKMYMALRLRVNLPERKKRLRTEDVEELGRMHEHVDDLEHHLRCMTPDLTENTEHYLFLMRCLGDLGQVQQE